MGTKATRKPATSGGSRRRPDAAGPDRPEPAKRRRPPAARVTPEALATARGGAKEGLAWLGRTPESRASIGYRLVRRLARFVLFVVLRFRIRTDGREHLPRGGYLLVFFQQPSGSASVMTTLLSVILLWRVVFPVVGEAAPPGRRGPAASPA